MIDQQLKPEAGARRAMTERQQDEMIERFARLYARLRTNLMKVLDLIVPIYERVPNGVARLVEACPSLSRATIERMYNVALVRDQQVAECVLLESCPGAIAISRCPTNVQKELVVSEFEVVTGGTITRPEITKKSYRQLTTHDVRQLFDKKRRGRVRSVEEQIALRQPKPKPADVEATPKGMQVNKVMCVPWALVERMLAKRATFT